MKGQKRNIKYTPLVKFASIVASAILVLNLLPVPVLDGGHLALYAYEAVTRRKPSESALGMIQRIGLALILFITVIALANDINRLFGG